MSYRKYLHKGDEQIEIRDETPIIQLEKVNPIEDKEYPDYIVDREAMIGILKFYQQRLFDIATERTEETEKREQTRMFWYGVAQYFIEFDIDNLIKKSDIFLIEYFYLVDIYRNTNWDNETLIISHG